MAYTSSGAAIQAPLEKKTAFRSTHALAPGSMNIWALEWAGYFDVTISTTELFEEDRYPSHEGRENSESSLEL